MSILLAFALFAKGSWYILSDMSINTLNFNLIFQYFNLVHMWINIDYFPLFAKGSWYILSDISIVLIF